MSREEIDQSNNVLQTVLHQLAKAQATRDLAKLDLERTVIRAPSDGWVTNLNVYAGEFITRGSTAVALVKQNSFYVLAYMEETKLEGVRSGYRAEITPLGSNRVLKGTVDSVAAGVTNASSTNDSKGMATVDSNLEWVRLAQRVPVRIRLDEQQSNLWPAGTTATVVITGEKDRDASQILSSVKSPIACASLVDRYGHFSIASQHIRFAVKLACAIVLALFVGFHFQLETPRWAVLTAAIVAAALPSRRVASLTPGQFAIAGCCVLSAPLSAVSPP